MRSFAARLGVGALVAVAGCARVVEPFDARDAAPDAVAVDAPVSNFDLSPRPCTGFLDCVIGTGVPTPLCAIESGWSCIESRCIWACQPLHNTVCRTSASGCVACDRSGPGSDACPSTPCVTRDVATARIVQGTCRQQPPLDGAQCMGRWVRMRDGTLWSLSVEGGGASTRAFLAMDYCMYELAWD